MTELFPAGTFSPIPGPAACRGCWPPVHAGSEVVAAQRRATAALSHVHPSAADRAPLLPLGDFGSNRVAVFTPAIMAVAVISTAFTGQAIAVAFDHRYGALKKAWGHGTSGLGHHRRKDAGGRDGGVLQAMLLGGIGLALGWRPNPAGLLLGAVVIALGTATFVSMGLLLGGTLRAEIVLAVANLMWFVFAAIGALTLETAVIPRALAWVAGSPRPAP